MYCMGDQPRTDTYCLKHKNAVSSRYEGRSLEPRYPLKC